MDFLYFCIVFCLIGIIISRNPVHSVLWLISLFLCVGLLFFFLNEAFIALTVLIVYVGAVAVLVLFVCMLLETKLVEIRSISHVSDLLFAGYIIVFCLLSILGDFSYVYLSNINSFSYEEYLPWIVFFGQISVLNALSIVLYVYYGIFLVVTSYILLIALIGAVVLTLYHRGNVRRQNVFKQMYHELGVLNNRRVVAK